MSFNQASEMLEGEGARVDLKEWNDPLNPQTGAGTVDLDEIDADEESRWYILGLIPTTESVHDGMLLLGEWHQPVSVEGYLVASNASNAYGYHSSQTVTDDCTVLIGNQNREQLFVMVTGINLEDASVSSSGDADDEWVHGDVPILGRTWLCFDVLYCRYWRGSCLVCSLQDVCHERCTRHHEDLARSSWN
jgi:hypothetical protein